MVRPGECWVKDSVSQFLQTFGNGQDMKEDTQKLIQSLCHADRLRVVWYCDTRIFWFIGMSLQAFCLFVIICLNEGKFLCLT